MKIIQLLVNRAWFERAFGAKEETDEYISVDQCFRENRFWVDTVYTSLEDAQRAHPGSVYREVTTKL